jgi:hypothetical protein
MTIQQNEKLGVLFYTAVDMALEKAGRTPDKAIGIDAAWGHYIFSKENILQVHVYTQPLFNLDFLVVVLEYNTEWLIELDVLLTPEGAVPDRSKIFAVNRTDKSLLTETQLLALEEAFIFGKDKQV